MIQQTSQTLSAPDQQISAEVSRQLLYKLRDLNLTAERILLSDGRRVDFHGCLNPSAPLGGQLHYRLTLDNSEERLFAIALDSGRLRLSLITGQNRSFQRARYLNLVADEHGQVSAPQLSASINPEAARADEVGEFLRDLTLACLPAC